MAYAGPFRRKPPAGAHIPEGRINGGFYLCNEPGSVCHDATGRNAPMLLQGTVDRIAGPFGGPALKPDGATGYGVIPLGGNNILNWSTGDANPRPRTIWMWVYNPDIGGNGVYFSKGDNFSDSGFLIYTDEDAILDVKAIGNGNGTGNASGPISIAVRLWTHVAVTWSGLSGFNNHLPIVYLNGIQDTGFNAFQNGGEQDNDDTYDLHIGHSQYPEGTSGPPFGHSSHYIDHFGWDFREYSPLEIRRLVAEPFKMFAGARHVWNPVVDLPLGSATGSATALAYPYPYGRAAGSATVSGVSIPFRGASSAVTIISG